MPSADLAVLDVGCINKGAQCRPCQQRQSDDKDVLYFFFVVVCLTVNNVCFVFLMNELCLVQRTQSLEWFSWTKYLASLRKNCFCMSLKTYLFFS